jgi:hypothetical protein
MEHSTMTVSQILQNYTAQNFGSTETKPCPSTDDAFCKYSYMQVTQYYKIKTARDECKINISGNNEAVAGNYWQIFPEQFKIK